jgi:hypothetical protein
MCRKHLNRVSVGLLILIFADKSLFLQDLFLIIGFPFYICPRYLCNGVPNKIRAEIILTKPDPDNAGGGKAKQGICPTPLVSL